MRLAPPFQQLWQRKTVNVNIIYSKLLKTAQAYAANLFQPAKINLFKHFQDNGVLHNQSPWYVKIPSCLTEQTRQNIIFSLKNAVKNKVVIQDFADHRCFAGVTNMMIKKKNPMFMRDDSSATQCQYKLMTPHGRTRRVRHANAAHIEKRGASQLTRKTA